MNAYPITTTAILSHAPKEGQLQWRKETLQLREPLYDELIVRMVATGVCPSDLRMSMLPPGVPGFSAYPKVMGHEGAGIVERVGSGVTHVKEGDKVLLSFDYCGKHDCRACSEETPGYCGDFQTKNFFSKPDIYQGEGGTTAAGFFFGQSSFSRLALVKSTSALNVSKLAKDEEELKLFAPMGCGFQAGSAVISELAGVGEEDAITIFGLGTVGLTAVMAAKIRGVKTIIGVDRKHSRFSLARELGATHIIDTSQMSSLTIDLTTAINDIVPTGTNANFDTTGDVAIIDAGVKTLHHKGQMILIGVVNGTLGIELGPMLVAGTMIRGSVEGNTKPSKWVPQMIEWYRDGKFPIDKLVKQYAFDDFEKALADMRAGTTIKPVLVW